MNITDLIKHPELMDKDTLYDLRGLLALYPFYQTARILLLQNMYLLHDPSFDEELRRAAIYITDRRIIFNLIEAKHYEIKKTVSQKNTSTVEDKNENRTISLIDDFLESIPSVEDKKSQKRAPTPIDAAVDYVSYLMETESTSQDISADSTPQLKSQNLIDDFIYKEGGKIQLKDDPEYEVQTESDQKEDDDVGNEGYFTETLAKIYIKQGKYSKAAEIIRRLNLNYPKKNAYFADQLRFLEKLILNNKTK